MNGPEGDALEPFLGEEEHAAQFSQAGSIEDSSLNQLREQIKKVMIPLLIKSFQLKLELSQAISLPSRLQPMKKRQSAEKIIEQLKQLDKDLHVLSLWCQSCHNQIQKALLLPEEEVKAVVASDSSPNPAVSKFFSDTLSAQSTQIKTPCLKTPQVEDEACQLIKKKNWWRRIFS